MLLVTTRYDRWDVSMADSMVKHGNDVACKQYLSELPPGFVLPNSQTDDEQLRTHIRNKVCF